MSAAFAWAVTALGMVLSQVSRKTAMAMQLGLALSSPSLMLVGYTWPLEAMPWGYEKLARIFLFIILQNPCVIWL